MLVWTRRSRGALLALLGLLVAILLIAPLAVVVIASVARTWNGVLPGALTVQHLHDALTADALASLEVSVQTAVLASAVAVAVGTWAALALPHLPRRLVDGHGHRGAGTAVRHEHGLPLPVVAQGREDGVHVVLQVHGLVAARHPWFAELARLHVDEVALPTGHWPMWSRARELAGVLLAAP